MKMDKNRIWAQNISAVCVFMSVRVHLHMQRVCVSLCGGWIPASNWVQPFNVSQGLLVRVIHDASKLPLLLSPFSCPLCAL